MPVALITGASKGFGLALARTLAGAGWSLVIDARNPDDLDAAALELSRPTVVRALAGDVADPSHREALAAAVGDFGRLDLLVNNASTLGRSPLPALSELSPELLAQILAVNLVAPHALVHRLLPHLLGASGTIVNVTSDAAVEAYDGWGGYGASKAALEHLSAVLAVEQPSLRVYWFDPGDMRTRMHQDAFPGEDISDRPEPETVVPTLVRLVEDRPPSGRYRAADLVVASP
jgi:NAD(P)-dependent dehydrogenase (short-subunit alcohol dehydrogenase family)